jgi:hypothetical protein
MSVMVALIGEQPVPNLLPLLHFAPTEALLVHTQRTAPQKERLAQVLMGRMNISPLDVPPYAIDQIRALLERAVDERLDAGEVVIFNLTGGTKPMAFAAYELAVQKGCEFVYFQTEGRRSVVYRYAVTDGRAMMVGEPETVGPLLTLDDFLRLHAEAYTEEGPKEDFERMVGEAFRASPLISEVHAGVRLLSALEIDLVIRCGNQVGIAEVKRQAKKQGIDQLHSATEQRQLGTYTQKFLISGAAVDVNNRELAKAYHVHVVELPSAETGALSEVDIQRLLDMVTTQLGAHA